MGAKRQHPVVIGRQNVKEADEREGALGYFTVCCVVDWMKKAAHAAARWMRSSIAWRDCV
jgi:hypothetical protein